MDVGEYIGGRWRYLIHHDRSHFAYTHVEFSIHLKGTLLRQHCAANHLVTVTVHRPEEVTFLITRPCHQVRVPMMRDCPGNCHFHRIPEADHFRESERTTPQGTVLVEQNLRWLSVAMDNVFELQTCHSKSNHECNAWLFRCANSGTVYSAIACCSAFSRSFATKSFRRIHSAPL